MRELRKTLSRLFLQDNFAPVYSEITESNLTVIGQIPQELSGLYLRIGPNPKFPPAGLYHWFDGDGMLHGVNIENSQASYRNRYVQTTTLKIETKEGKPIWPGLLNRPRFDSPYGIRTKNPANTSLIFHAGKLLALFEAGLPHHIQVPDLETIGAYTFDDRLTCSFTAHPKIDPETGEMIFFGYSCTVAPYLCHGVITAKGEISHIEPISLPKPIIMHDFAITEHYSLFLDLPFFFQIGKALKGKVPLHFDKCKKSRIGIIPRHGGNRSIRWFEISTCMVFHTANAYEEGEEIVLLGLRMSSTNLLIPRDDVEVGKSFGDELAKMYCWRINLKTGVVQEQLLDDQVAEFPRVNDRLIGRRMRYVYAGQAALYTGKPLFDGVRKYDLDQNRVESCFYGRGRFGGECVFIPRPGNNAEDDGWLMSYVHDTISDRSELLILNAQSIGSGPVARIMLPQRVPYGFHCTWISSEQMKSSIIGASFNNLANAPR